MFFFFFLTFLSFFKLSSRCQSQAPTPVTLFFFCCSFLPQITFIHNVCFCLSLFFCVCVCLFVFVRPSVSEKAESTAAFDSRRPAVQVWRKSTSCPVIGQRGRTALVQPVGRGYAQSRSETLSSKPPHGQSNQLAEGLARAPPLPLQTAPPVADGQVAGPLAGDGCPWLCPWASLWPAASAKPRVAGPAREC